MRDIHVRDIHETDSDPTIRIVAERSACCFSAMVTLLAAAPAAAGTALAPEVYSAHVDMHQRLLVRLREPLHVSCIGYTQI